MRYPCSLQHVGENEDPGCFDILRFSYTKLFFSLRQQQPTRLINQIIWIQPPQAGIYCRDTKWRIPTSPKLNEYTLHSVEGGNRSSAMFLYIYILYIFFYSDKRTTGLVSLARSPWLHKSTTRHPVGRADRDLHIDFSILFGCSTRWWSSPIRNVSMKQKRKIRRYQQKEQKKLIHKKTKQNLFKVPIFNLGDNTTGK